MNIAAVLVSYNSGRHIGACLDSCLAFRHHFPAGILVVDNASTDNTLAEVEARPAVTVCANATNLGFAAAVNQGFAHSPAADAVLVLNPDVVLLQPPTALEAELAAADVAVAAGRLLDPSGLPQRGFQVRSFPTPAALIFETLGLNRIWPSNPVNSRYRCLKLDLTRPADVEQPPGACLLIRRQAWLAAGGFDERFYPVWFEDVDFLKRASTLGWRTRFTPAFSALHHGAHSFEGVEPGTRQLYWYGSLLRYSALHFRQFSSALIGGAIVLGLIPRAVTGMFLRRSGQPIANYVKVVRLVFAYLWKGFIPSKRGASGHSNRFVPPPAFEDNGPAGS